MQRTTDTSEIEKRQRRLEHQRVQQRERVAAETPKIISARAGWNVSVYVAVRGACLREMRNDGGGWNATG